MMSHKFLIQVAIVVMISTVGIGAAFAQDNGDDPSPMPPIDGSCLSQIERPDFDRDARLGEGTMSSPLALFDGNQRTVTRDNFGNARMTGEEYECIFALHDDIAIRMYDRLSTVDPVKHNIHIFIILQKVDRLTIHERPRLDQQLNHAIIV